MTCSRCLAALAGIALLLAGCGKPMLKTKGRVVKGGAPFLPGQGEFVRVTFVPVVEGSRPARDFFVAEVDPSTSNFHVSGKDGRGMPPGKYRVAIELDHKRSDLLKGKFDAEKSPFVFDIDSRTKEIVVDLDDPPK